MQLIRADIAAIVLKSSILIYIENTYIKYNIYCAKKRGGGGSRDLTMVSVSMDSCLKFFLTKRA